MTTGSDAMSERLIPLAALSRPAAATARQP
jgi:hypothetical protein